MKNILPFAGLEKLIKETETKASVPLMGFLTRGRRDYEADAGDETIEVEGGGSGKEMIEADGKSSAAGGEISANGGAELYFQFTTKNISGTPSVVFQNYGDKDGKTKYSFSIKGRGPVPFKIPSFGSGNEGEKTIRELIKIKGGWNYNIQYTM